MGSSERAGFNCRALGQREALEQASGLGKAYHTPESSMRHQGRGMDTGAPSQINDQAVLHQSIRPKQTDDMDRLKENTVEFYYFWHNALHNHASMRCHTAGERTSKLALTYQWDLIWRDGDVVKVCLLNKPGIRRRWRQQMLTSASQPPPSTLVPCLYALRQDTHTDSYVYGLRTKLPTPGYTCMSRATVYDTFSNANSSTWRW